MRALGLLFLFGSASGACLDGSTDHDCLDDIALGAAIELTAAVCGSPTVGPVVGGVDLVRCRT